MFKTDTIKNYRADIDGLRAISVILVMLFHAKIPGFSGGFIGVDVFFVISGFLITSHLKSELSKNGSISFLTFYTRRIKRLLPAILTVLAFCLLVWFILFTHLPKETRQFHDSFVSSILAFANFHFLTSTTDYFSSAVDEMPLLHFWSLAVEEQFYLVWPALLMLTQIERIFKKTNYQIKPEVLNKRIFLLLTSICISSLLLSEYFIISDKSERSFYLMPARAWELGMGGLLCIIIPKIHKSNKSKLHSSHIQSILYFLAFILILIPAILLNKSSRFPGLIAILPTMGAAIIIVLGSLNIKNSYFYKLLTAPIMVWVGLLSYGLYLWHWPLLAFSKLYLMGEDPSILIRLLLVGISFPLAFLMYHFIERPIRFNQLLKNKNSFFIITFVTVTIGCFILVNKQIKNTAYNYKKENKDFFKLLGHRDKLKKTCYAKPKNWGKSQCMIGNKSSKKHIVILGNSHAAAVVPIVRNYIKDYPEVSASLISTSFTKSRGGLGLIHSPDVQKKYQEFNSLVFQTLEKQFINESTTKSLLIATRLTKGLCLELESNRDGIYCIDKNKSHPGSIKAISNSLRSTIKSFKELGFHKVLILKPWPEFKYYSSECLNLSSKKCQTNLNRGRYAQYSKIIEQMITKLELEFDYVSSIAPKKHLCPEQSCSQIILRNDKKIPIVHDDDHPTTSGLKIMKKPFYSRLKWLVE